MQLYFKNISEHFSYYNEKYCLLQQVGMEFVCFSFFQLELADNYIEERRFMMVEVALIEVIFWGTLLCGISAELSSMQL